MSNRIYADGILISGTGSPGNRVYADGILIGGVTVPTATITTTKDGTFTSNWRGTDQAKLTFDWGDGGAPSEITLLGSSTNVPANHTYSSGVEKTITITGDLLDIEWALAYYGNNITSFDLSKTSVSILEFSNNDIVNIQSLASTLTITECYLYNNNIVDLTPVSGHPMPYLYISGNNISDISPIVGNTSLNRLLILTSNPISYSGYTWATKTTGRYKLDSALTTSGEVDQVMIDLSVGYAEWRNTTTYLDGTNPARSSASDAAVAWFVTVGLNTLQINE
jgi:hypothetical protein